MHRTQRPASKLDPYRTIVLRWQGEGLSTRDIAAKLAEEYQLRVSFRTVHAWLSTHAEASREDNSTPAPSPHVGESKFSDHPSARLRGAQRAPEKNRHGTLGGGTKAEDAPDTSAALLARLAELEDRLVTLQEEKPVATVPALSWGNPPGLRDVPLHLSSHRSRRRFGYAVLLVLLGVTLYWLYSLVAENPLLAAVVSFLAAPVRSSQHLYAQLTVSPIAMIMTAVILCGLAIGYRWKTAVLATLVWFMHLSMERSDFVTFTVLLFLCGRLSAAMLRRADQASGRV